MRAKLIREYPLKIANLTVGNTYEIVDIQSCEKLISPRNFIPLTFWSIINDLGDSILVSTCYFEVVE